MLGANISPTSLSWRKRGGGKNILSGNLFLKPDSSSIFYALNVRKGFQSFITNFFFDYHLWKFAACSGISLWNVITIIFSVLVATSCYKGRDYLLIKELCTSSMIMTINKWEYVWQREKRKFRMSYHHILAWQYARSRYLNICWKDWLVLWMETAK